jgi:toxin ParE1/3/4
MTPPRPRRLPIIRWTQRARRDLRHIGDHIALDDPAAAARWVERLVLSVEQAAAMPRSGRVVPEVGKPHIRELIRGSYRIVYWLRPGGIDVLTVFEGHRLLPPGLIGPIGH